MKKTRHYKKWFAAMLVVLGLAADGYGTIHFSRRELTMMQMLSVNTYWSPKGKPFSYAAIDGTFLLFGSAGLRYDKDGIGAYAGLGFTSLLQIQGGLFGDGSSLRIKCEIPVIPIGDEGDFGFINITLMAEKYWRDSYKKWDGGGGIGYTIPMWRKSDGGISRSTRKKSPFLIENDTLLRKYIGMEKNVTIPSSITTIEKCAFCDMKLKSVIIPNSVTTIGESAFKYNKLTDVTIPNNVKVIERSAFMDNKLIKVIIPDGVTEIGSFAFCNNRLTDIIIPNSVTTIGENAFSNNKLTDVTIPQSVTVIGDGAFDGNPLTNITVAPGNTEFITERSFLLSKDKTRLILYYGNEKNAVIPDGVTTIADNAFSKKQLTGITIPNSVTEIGSYAFSDNPLKHIIIPSNVVMEDNVFAGVSLRSITIGDNVELSGYGGFCDLYKKDGKRAGTYILTHAGWMRKE